MHKFKDKIVIVTGAGSGIGRGTAVAFAAAGATVIVADIVEADGQESVAEIAQAGGKAEFVRLDAGDSASNQALIDGAAARHGRLDVLFVNAGVFDRFLPAQQIDDALWAKVVGVDLSGYFYAARAALPHLIKTKGNVVMTASTAALGGNCGGAAYTAAKHGVVGLVHQLGLEFAAQGVRVNGVAPGAIRTRIGRDMPEDSNSVEYVMAHTPLKRFGEPEDVAKPVLFLASDDASFITGTVLRVDGGWRSM